MSDQFEPVPFDGYGRAAIVLIEGDEYMVLVPDDATALVADEQYTIQAQPVWIAAKDEQGNII